MPAFLTVLAGRQLKKAGKAFSSLTLLTNFRVFTGKLVDGYSGFLNFRGVGLIQITDVHWIIGDFKGVDQSCFRTKTEYYKKLLCYS